jgi:hypothetical protein
VLGCSTLIVDGEPLISEWLARMQGYRGVINAMLPAIPVGLSAPLPATDSSTTSRGDNKENMTWQKVAARLEELRSRGEKFTSHQDYADRFCCSTSTVNRAIHKTDSLKPWATRESKPKVTQMSALVSDNQAQSREPDPSNSLDEDLDQITAQLAKESPSVDRDELKADLGNVAPEKRRAIVDLVKNDPDKGKKSWSRL